MQEQLSTFWQQLLAHLEGYYQQAFAALRALGPRNYALLGGALLLLLLTWWLSQRRRTRRRRHPEVMVSLGSITPMPAEDRGFLRPPQYRLKATVSNLNSSSLQLLEVALKTPHMEVPLVEEVAVVIGPEGSEVLEAMMPEISGEAGILNIYFYSAQGKKLRKHKLYRLQATFHEEPWNNRYKISPLEQQVFPAKRLASTGLSRIEADLWRERYADDHEDVRLPLPQERLARLQAEGTPPSEPSLLKSGSSRYQDD